MDSNYSRLIRFTIKSLKLGLTIINPFKTNGLLCLEKQINDLQTDILKFRLKNKDCLFIDSYCKILYKLPKLTLIRRGLCTNSVSLTSLDSIN